MPTCVPWTADTSCDTGWDELDPALQERATTLAWNTIKALSGGRLGHCPVTMRPCLTAPCEVCAASWMNPRVVDGEWINVVCGGDPCSCERMCEIVTPGPIAQLDEVLLDGTALPLTDFRVDNGNRIVRTDGACWPSCQNMNAALDQVGTLGITYTPGIRPDESGLWAAGLLASEFAKACTGSGKCRLPSSVSVVARNGVTFETQVTMFPNNQTGIREVDAYILSINPNGLKLPSLVYSPDLPQTKHRFTTWRQTA